MITELNSSISNISPEALDKLFSEVPDTQVTADDLKVPEVIGKDTVIKNSDIDLPEIDLDKLEEVETTEEVKDEVKEDTEEVDEKDDKKDKAEKKEDKTAKKDDSDQKLTPEEIQARNDFLKNSVNYLVEKGLFKDFEGREELEVDEEVFSQLLEKQIEKQIEEKYEFKKKSAGEIGEALLEYLENGGEPDKIIDLFKEKKSIEEFPIEDDASQTELISKWYREVHGWKPEKIKKYLDTLNSEEGMLESEAEEIKGKYQELYSKQLEEVREEQKTYALEQQKKQKAFEQNITKAIESNKDFDLKTKKFIKDSIFKFKTLEDGTKVNEFYLKFAEWQSDPSKYIELAEFILDKEGYLKRKAVDIENKVVEKTFNFVKGNSAVTKTKGSRHIEADTSKSGTDFSVIFK